MKCLWGLRYGPWLNPGNKRVSYFGCLPAKCKTLACIHGNSYECFEESQMTVSEISSLVYLIYYAHTGMLCHSRNSETVLSYLTSN